MAIVVLRLVESDAFETQQTASKPTILVDPFGGDKNFRQVSSLVFNICGEIFSLSLYGRLVCVQRYSAFQLGPQTD